MRAGDITTRSSPSAHSSSTSARSSLACYWGSRVVTVGSDGAVTIRAVASFPLAPYPWEAKSSWTTSGPQPGQLRCNCGKPIFQPLESPSGPRWRRSPLRSGLDRTGPYTVHARRARTCSSATALPGAPGAAARPRGWATRRGCCCQGILGRRLGVWTGEYSGSRTSTASLYLPRAAAAVAGKVARYLFRPSRPGAQQQRLPPERCPALPRRRQPPRVRHAGVRQRRRPGRARQGGRADPGGAAGGRRPAAARGGHRRRHLPVQEQRRLRRQPPRLPGELPGRPARRVRPAGRHPDPVPGHQAAHLRRRQGGAGTARRRRTASAGRPGTSGTACRPRPPGPGRSSVPATSRAPPRGCGGCA